MSAHIVQPKTYFKIYVCLLILTGLTVGISRIHLSDYGLGEFGFLHTPIGLLIAIAKASLVILFFMHIYYSPRLVWVVALGSLLWLAILIFLTMNDYLTRSWDNSQLWNSPFQKQIQCCQWKAAVPPAKAFPHSTDSPVPAAAHNIRHWPARRANTFSGHCRRTC